ncbi:hypothetical protein BH20ACT8_BH20ACT8_10600 [soil metagenome]
MRSPQVLLRPLTHGRGGGRPCRRPSRRRRSGSAPAAAARSWAGTRGPGQPRALSVTVEGERPHRVVHGDAPAAGEPPDDVPEHLGGVGDHLLGDEVAVAEAHRAACPGTVVGRIEGIRATAQRAITESRPSEPPLSAASRKRRPAGRGPTRRAGRAWSWLRRCSPRSPWAGLGVEPRPGAVEADAVTHARRMQLGEDLTQLLHRAQAAGCPAVVGAMIGGRTAVGQPPPDRRHLGSGPLLAPGG